MDEADRSLQERAAKRAEDYTGMLWHIATFVIVNAFLWTIDLLSGGLDWAYWVTASWGIGLLFHIAYYMIDVRGQGKRYERFLEDEKKRASGV